MKKINKKGFTLVELLGVIVILILILSLVLPKIIGRTKSKDEQVVTLKDDIVIKAAKLYLEESVKPENDNTYCVDINNLVEKEYLLYDENYEGKKVKADYTNDGYSYSIDSSCTASSSSDARCESEGLCTVCYVSKTYNNGVYQYEPKTIDTNTLGLPSINISYVENENDCAIEAVKKAARDYYDNYSYMFKKRVGNVYCLSLDTLLNQNRISQSLYNNITLLGYTSVKVSYNHTTKNFDFSLETSCTANITTICTAISGDDYGSTPTVGKYVPGDTYDCAVNSSNTYRFYLLSSDDTTVTFVMKYNLTGGNGVWGCIPGKNGSAGNSTVYGPNRAFTNLYENTSSWNYIDNIVVNFDDPKGKYGGIKTIIDSSGNYITNIYMSDNTISESFTNLKARLMTYKEMQDNGCNKGSISYVFQSLYTCDSDNQWISSSNTWLLDAHGSTTALKYERTLGNNNKYYKVIIPKTTCSTSGVYRPVIVVSKADLSINSGNY